MWKTGMLSLGCWRPGMWRPGRDFGDPRCWRLGYGDLRCRTPRMRDIQDRETWDMKTWDVDPWMLTPGC